MVRVIAPTTALMIFGVVYCNNGCGACSGSDSGMGSASIDEAENFTSIKASDPQSVFRPLSPTPSALSGTVEQDNFEEDEEDEEEEDEELVSIESRARSSSVEYDGDCERTPNHLYRKILAEIPKKLSDLVQDGRPNVQGGIFESDEDLIGRPADNSGTPCSSNDSLVKTRGGSKSSNCQAIRKVTGRRKKPVKKVIIDFSNSFNSYKDTSTFVSEGENQILRVQSESPYYIRVHRIETEMAVAPEASIENQIFKEIYPKVSNGPHCEILDGIDRLASEELQKVSKQIGTFIFEHLWYQNTQIDPEKPITATEAYEFFNLLNEIYDQVISIHGNSGIRFDLCQLIQECLNSTLVGDFSHFKPVRDAILLLISKYPNYFDEDFLETVDMYETLKAIVQLSDDHRHLDTLEYVRVILSFPNLNHLEQYFEIYLRKLERKPSDELFLPLMETNLLKSISASSDESQKSKSVEKFTSAEVAVKNKKKTEKQDTIPAVTINTDLMTLVMRLAMENRVVLAFAIILAILIQCLFLQK